MYTVYILIDPFDGLVRYVGMAQDIYARFVQHINCESRNPEKNLWITNCRSKNLMIQMRTIESVESREEALELEKKWIEHYTSLGMPLFNKKVFIGLQRQRVNEERQLEIEVHQHQEEKRKQQVEKEKYMQELRQKQQEIEMMEREKRIQAQRRRLQKAFDTYQPGIGCREHGRLIGVGKDLAADLRRELKARGLINPDGSKSTSAFLV